MFNPTWVQPTHLNGNKSGLLVRSQNCTPAPPGKCTGCQGSGQRASWLTWAELEPDTGSPSVTPQVVGKVAADSAVFGPFDCANTTDPTCSDLHGTEDPRLTYDAESQLYYLLYNAWSGKTCTLAIATSKDPAVGPSGWQRHGNIFPSLKASYKSGSIVLTKAPSEHYVIWGCAHTMTITPSIGRDLLKWNHSASKVLFQTRHAPFWDTGFVESAMPPLPLATGDLLFFYNSVGAWNKQGGFQPGWVILSGEDPTTVLQRSSAPPMPYVLPWEVGTAPWPCNTRDVSNLGGGYQIAPNKFRVFFGGADAVVGAAVITVTASPATSPYNCSRDASGLGQCVPVDGPSTYSSASACMATCTPPPPPPPPVQPGVYV